jgi:hypothetical protein
VTFTTPITSVRDARDRTCSPQRQIRSLTAPS